MVWEAVASSKQTAADRYGISWRAVNNACVRVATEALGRLDLLDGLVAIAIDEVKYKKGQKYLTVVCDQFSGRVVWAAKGRSKDTVSAFFDALGDRVSSLDFVSCDGAEWIRTMVAERAPSAIVCLDPFHLVGWATTALDEVRRGEWNQLSRSGGAPAAQQVKGLRWLLLRNWENLTPSQRAVIGDLEKANRRMFRAYVPVFRPYPSRTYVDRITPEMYLMFTDWVEAGRQPAEHLGHLELGIYAVVL